MSESNFTPGPWWTDAKYDGQECGCSILAARIDSGPLPGNPTRGQVAFATEMLNVHARRCEANARLIAAAPDLLEALIDVYESEPGEVECWKKARAAIAKATEPPPHPQGTSKTRSA